jgi:hypothetical protein
MCQTGRTICCEGGWLREEASRSQHKRDAQWKFPSEQGAFVLGTGFSAEAATLAPRLHAPGATTLTSTDSGKEKKAHHAHKAQKKTVSHKVKKVKKFEFFFFLFSGTSP